MEQDKFENWSKREQLIYFAGLIDGEGHIGCQYYGKRKRPVIQLNMTHLPTVQRFADYFGMVVRELNSPSRIKDREERGHKQQYQCRVECLKAYPIIKELAPYLLTKYEDALEAIAYYDDRKCIVCDTAIPAKRNTNSKTCSHDCYLVNKKKVDAKYRLRKKEERAS